MAVLAKAHAVSPEGTTPEREQAATISFHK
jgi:hypothetical protein